MSGRAGEQAGCGMTMAGYVAAVKRQLRDRYGLPPAGGTSEEPVFDFVPDGDYPMSVEGGLDHVRVRRGELRCCCWREDEGPRLSWRHEDGHTI